MAEEQKKPQEEFKSCCEGMPFADLMRKMVETKKAGAPFNCAEMMSQMMRICCGTREKKEEAPQGAQEKPVTNS